MTTVSAIEAYRYVLGNGRRGLPSAIRATGTSMMPFIRPGDTVTLAPKARYRRGDTVFALAEEPRRVVLHAVTGIAPGGGHILMGTANLHLMELAPEGSIAGAVVTVERGGRRISADSRRWRAAMALWLALRPLRRPLIRAIRLIGWM